MCPPPEVVEQGLHVVKEYLSEKMNGAHQDSPKKRSWIGKLKRYSTFGVNRSGQDERIGYLNSSTYQTIDGLASPRYMGMFSPKRIFSPKKYFTMKF